MKRQFLWSMAPLIVISAVNIFSVPLFYRYLGVEMYALWLFINTVTGMFGFADLGLGVAVSRYVGISLGKGDDKAVHEYWGTGNLMAIPLLALMGTAFAALGFFLDPMWFNVAIENRTVWRACFLLGGFSLFLNYYGQIWFFLLQAHLEFKFTNMLRTGITLLQVLGSLLVAWRTGDPAWICAWTALMALLQLILLTGHSWRHYGVGFDLQAASFARAREMALFTGKIFVSLITGVALGSIDRLILKKLAPASDFTHYSICGNVGARLQGLGSAVVGPIFHNTNRTLGGGQNSAAKIYDEMFTFTFQWYLLVAIWLSVWHPVLLRLWLGEKVGAVVAPLFVPLVVAFCLMGLANISISQLSALNRVGIMVGFATVAGLMAAGGVYVGWHYYGVVGVAYGFLVSRLPLVVQDLYTIRMTKAGGWLSPQTWMQIGAQSVVAGIFALVYLSVPCESYWLLLPATLHGITVALWLLRKPLQKWYGVLKSLNAV